METPVWNIPYLREKNVYEPAEDTFLLLDTLEEDIQNLVNLKPTIVLEIGSGSGIVLTAISSLLGSSAYHLAIDINPDACLVTKNTARLNNVKIDIVNGDLLECFQGRKIIDIIIFNPPYVETANDETSVAGIAQSWAGGEDGRIILNRLMPQLNDAVSLNGIVYLIAISYNNVPDLLKRMNDFGFKGTVLKTRQIPGELLHVLKFIKMGKS